MRTALNSPSQSARQSDVRSHIRNCTCRSISSDDSPGVGNGSSGSNSHGTANHKNSFPQKRSKPQKQKQHVDKPASQALQPVPPKHQGGATPARRQQKRENEMQGPTPVKVSLAYSHLNELASYTSESYLTSPEISPWSIKSRFISFWSCLNKYLGKHLLCGPT